MGVVGASGTGKSVLTRAILGLVPKTRGRIVILQADMDQLDYAEQRVVEQRLGVMFQHGALFSSLDREAERAGADAGISRPVAEADG